MVLEDKKEINKMIKELGEKIIKCVEKCEYQYPYILHSIISDKNEIVLEADLKACTMVLKIERSRRNKTL